MAEQFDVEQARQVIENGMGQAQELISDPAKIQELLGQVGDFVQKLPEEAAGALANIPLMAEMVRDYVTGAYPEVSPKVVATLVAALLYLLNGKDFIPDNIPLLGLVDDVAVVALALKLDEEELAAYQAWKDSREKTEGVVSQDAPQDAPQAEPQDAPQAEPQDAPQAEPQDAPQAEPQEDAKA